MVWRRRFKNGKTQSTATDNSIYPGKDMGHKLLSFCDEVGLLEQ